MCFSASASFVAGIGLSGIGVATLKKARQKNELPFALIPLFFGVQQITEGLLWLSLSRENILLTAITTDLFSLFSHAVWPIFVPFSVLMLETVAWRRKVISGFLCSGIVIGLYLLYLISKFPVVAVAHEHIIYISPHFYKAPSIILYVASTCIVSLFSSHRIVKIFGAFALILFVITSWFYTTALFSVWCFFSAILSLIIYLYFRLKYPVNRSLLVGPAKV